MDEEKKRTIETLSVVSSVCFHVVNATHKTGVYPNLKCSEVSSDGDCGENQHCPIRMSRIPQVSPFRNGTRPKR